MKTFLSNEKAQFEVCKLDKLYKFLPLTFVSVGLIVKLEVKILKTFYRQFVKKMAEFLPNSVHKERNGKNMFSKLERASLPNF